MVNVLPLVVRASKCAWLYGRPLNTISYGVQFKPFDHKFWIWSYA